MKHPAILFSLLGLGLAQLTHPGHAQGPINDGTTTPMRAGIDATGKKFVEPKVPVSAFAPTQVNPYTRKPLKEIEDRNVSYNRTEPIDIPIGGSVVINLRTTNGDPVIIESINMSQVEAYEVSVEDNVITLTSRLKGVTIEQLKRSESQLGVLRESLMWIKTPQGLLTIRLSLVAPHQAPQTYNLGLLNYSQGVPYTGEGIPPQPQFNYNLNPAPLNPLTRKLDHTTESGFNPGISGAKNTDLGSQSPEASPFNPYGVNGPVGTQYFQPSHVKAPEIDSGKLPIAINMIRSYDRQRARGATSDQDIQRYIIGKPYQMSPDQTIYLAEAYRFPKYQTTIIRVAWQNTTPIAHYIDPTRIGLKTGRFAHIPARFGQVRNVVYPGQNNEVFLVYRIPDAALGQNYEMILPEEMATARDAGPQMAPNPLPR
jgi:hypothetical protein